MKYLYPILLVIFCSPIYAQNNDSNGREAIHLSWIDKYIAEDDDFILYKCREAYFPDSELDMMKFVADNLRYPQKAYEKGIEGRVVVRMIISKEGEVTNAKVLKGIDTECDAEAIRIVESMPLWHPAQLNGINVAYYFTIPILFRKY